MRQIRLIVFLLLPSLSSGALCLGLSIGFLLFINWAFIAHNAFLYNYFFGPEGLQAALQSASFSPVDMWHTLFARHASRTVLSYLFILLITLVVYSVLEGGTHAYADVSGAIKELQSAQHWHYRLLTWELWGRILSRVAILAVWLSYAVLFMRLVLPLCISHARFGIATIGHLQHVPDLLLGVVGLFIGLHAHVIFLRLLMLRPRVFGGVAMLLEAEQQHSL